MVDDNIGPIYLPDRVSLKTHVDGSLGCPKADWTFQFDLLLPDGIGEEVHHPLFLGPGTAAGITRIAVGTVLVLPHQVLRLVLDFLTLLRLD